MNWTKERPTKPGAYSWRTNDGFIGACEIVRIEEKLYTYIKAVDMNIELSNTVDDVEWLGPLPE